MRRKCEMSVTGLVLVNDGEWVLSSIPLATRVCMTSPLHTCVTCRALVLRTLRNTFQQLVCIKSVTVARRSASSNSAPAVINLSFWQSTRAISRES